MKVSNFDEFLETSKAIFENHPYKARYLYKYRKCDARIEMKVTDDEKCIKYVTESANDLKAIEQFNGLILHVTTGRKFDPSEFEKPVQETTTTKKKPAKRS
mmetsp:Transcript_50039/g.128796  ORF Transcript_50039/g.128796 Transcript_50039/m.128796 type:complete len:101 (-) Transcript_50039:341-643(-)|eukprot:CAMPEP_0113885180 /NCGR_PEP_ID=MMETSP0780_2-20120614/10751_1 /TAXON_ID=652834 /ORGANISM="Palpitomonas bilix" /LENGTH=100 /DNA_ID=CAMNT_0000873045 /DNA_START=211 /DNA_END=513 /DNA_ORIENTATION=- /assembly_acc=CAM_ASM_000599